MHGKQVGYVRVSTTDQNTDRQLDGVHLDKVFTDKVSGGSLVRPALVSCLDFLREGDTLNVHSMDRLARNLADMLSLVKDLTSKGITIKFHKENLIFTGEHNPIQNLQLQIMCAVAEFERQMILERQKEGIKVAKAKGVRFGRPSKLSNEQVEEIVFRVRNGENKSLLATEFNISRETLYSYLRNTA